MVLLSRGLLLSDSSLILGVDIGGGRPILDTLDTMFGPSATLALVAFVLVR